MAKLIRQYPVVGEENVLTSMGLLTFVNGETEIEDDKAEDYQGISDIRVRYVPQAVPASAPAADEAAVLKAAADVETKRLADEQAAADAETKRLADEQAAADAETKRLADEQAAADVETKRLADEQAAADAEALKAAGTQTTATEVKTAAPVGKRLPPAVK